MPDNGTPLQVVGLTKRYGALTAVDEVDFALAPGELVGFIGPNGAGKSTTFRCIVGLQHPDEGEIAICGVDVLTDRIAALRKLGYVGQDLQLYQYLTGEELLRMVGQLHELDADVLEARIASLLELMDLQSARNRLVHQYSGGMARKLAIASAVIHRPPLILLDESFAGLDPEATVAIQGHIDELRSQGSAVLLSSHVLDMLERWVSRIVILHGGRIVADLPRDDLDAALRQGTLTELYLSKVGR